MRIALVLPASVRKSASISSTVGSSCRAGSFQGLNGEKENPGMRSGQGGSISGRFNRAQQQTETSATVTQIRQLILFMGIIDTEG
jgi:hypothetical protein